MEERGMAKIQMSLLRGVCQTPAYVAFAKGYFAAEGLDVGISIAPTAWMVPERLATGEAQFAIIPWTRVASDEGQREGLVLVAGSGVEEAAIVVRYGLDPDHVRKVAVPREGGMKDLTAMALIRSMGWHNAEILRFPSGDGAIICLFGQGADAASMVEPYAAMMEALEVGRVVKRTGDIWPGAPGCSLTTTARLAESEPALVQGIVNACVRAATFVRDDPAAAAGIAAGYIGVAPRILEKALLVNQPDVTAIRNADVMQEILQFMLQLGYITRMPRDFVNLEFLDHAQAAPADLTA